MVAGTCSFQHVHVPFNTRIVVAVVVVVVVVVIIITLHSHLY